MRTRAGTRRVPGRDEPPAPGRARGERRPLGAGSAATSWRRGCSSPSPRRPTSAASRAETHALYGLDRPESADFGRACLLARRLLERGVRFVQLWSGGFGGPTWDAHDDVSEEPRRGGPADRPARRRPAPRPAAARAARRHAGDLHHRVRPDAVRPVRRRQGRPGPRPQPGRLHRPGWPAPGSSTASPTARPTTFGYKAVENPVDVARLPRDDPAPAGHRPRAADVLPQRHPPPPDERPRPGRQGHPGLRPSGTG